MDVKTLASKFVGFLIHYSGEVGAIGEALNSVVGALPIDPADKTRITDITDALAKASANVGAAAQDLQGQAVEVVISAQDVEAAVGAFITAHPELFSTAPASGTGGNGGAPATSNPVNQGLASDQVSGEPMNSVNG